MAVPNQEQVIINLLLLLTLLLPQLTASSKSLHFRGTKSKPILAVFYSWQTN